MKIVISIILCLLSHYLIGQRIKDDSNKNADIIFFNKRIVFDDVVQGTVLKAKYEFINSSDECLIIKSVETDCGCTGYNYSNDTIPACEDGYIELMFNTKNKLGIQKHSAVVTFNTEVKFYKLRFRVQILEVN